MGCIAPTIRFGTPQEFAAFVDAAHRQGLGVLFDWVPGHFPTDAHGLGWFDGTPLYEHADPKEGFHIDWNTLIYNYGRTEVSNYLMANALVLAGGIPSRRAARRCRRLDALPRLLAQRGRMGAEQGWRPRELRGDRTSCRTNTLAYGECPGIMTVAEESTAFPGVSRPVDTGGLGFGFKWNMGWMNDTLSYIEKEPIYRKYHHHEMTFGLVYAWTENFILPISHDEVVHGKGSMLGKMPGTAWEKFANLRAYYGFMWSHPGKKLLFMGQEFAQGAEWNHDQSLDWHQADDPQHRGVQTLMRDLNLLYRRRLRCMSTTAGPRVSNGSRSNDAENSVFVFVRKGAPGDPMVVVATNITPVERRLIGSASPRRASGKRS